MHTGRPSTRLLLPLLATATLGLAACGGGSGSSNTGSGSTGIASAGSSDPGPGGGGTTVSIRSTDEGQALTDASGRTLYVSGQEMGKILCTSAACTAVWQPLTVASAAKPTA